MLGLTIAIFRVPSFVAALWAFMSLIDDLSAGHIGFGAPLRPVLLVPVALSAWCFCAFTPYSVLRKRPIRRVFLAVAAISACSLIYDQTVSIHYWRPELAGDVHPEHKQCIGSPPAAQSRVILGESPNYDMYVYQRCSMVSADLYMAAIYLTPLLGFVAYQVAKQRTRARAA